MNVQNIRQALGNPADIRPKDCGINENVELMGVHIKDIFIENHLYILRKHKLNIIVLNVSVYLRKRLKKLSVFFCLKWVY